jgi:TetR/AcrR family transcriptional repressor of nem operon
MPWPKDHKAATRQRIVEAAAAAFRAGGVAGVRVEDVMAAAGLTHGGFYAHFGSKDELVREAIARASDETIDRLSKPLAALPHNEHLQSVIETYLSTAHVTHPERGCPLAALGAEIARGDDPARATLAAGVKDRLRWMRRLPAGARAELLTDDQAIGILACMVGGVVLARAVGASDAPTVLEACRSFLRRALDEPGPVRKGRRATPRRKAASAAAPRRR